ncbi:sensor domain-containing diguanylate cyclase, partial [Chitinimonas sp.]|uniref:sensor domain-containing diguanylate cyclase n=1 Tax=Chitinimonas sp. TaxID=1934313 RepID=UPI002F95BD60
MSTPKIDLRRLILLLALGSVVLTLANTFYASYLVQRDLLIANTLEANRVYAAKLSEATETYLAGTIQQLAYSAQRLPALLAQPDALQQEADRLHGQTHSFNSVAVIDAKGKILATSPGTLHIVGTTTASPGAQAALKARAPLISPPYRSVTGRLILFISHPIFAADGTFLGYVGGSIYLHETNILHTLLGEHFYRDGSYVYVVDQSGRLIYHKTPQRIGELINRNSVVQAVIRGENGSQRVVNTQGTDMLAGYAFMKSTGWGVIAQRPTEVTLADLQRLMWVTLRNSLPLLGLSLLFIWWLSKLIARPLWQLARSAEQLDEQGTQEAIAGVRSWYFEASQLKRAMLRGLSLVNRRINRLSHETLTDALTGLSNRRGMDAALAVLQAEEQAFAVIAIDLDHFKQVNDRYGHDTGDQILKQLAELMRRNSRHGDTLARPGGEEFMMLLPGATMDTAQQVAQRLRLAMASQDNVTGNEVTISLGVAHWPSSDDDLATVIRKADIALYEAKHQGRNRVAVA